MAMPSYEEQIIQTHAGLIVQMVKAVFDPEARSEADNSLNQLKRFGEVKLAEALQQVLNGSRDKAILTHLEDEDRVIVSAVLQGIVNPDSLPNPHAGGDPSAAAPGLAHMIHAAATGDAQALHLLGGMAEQMTAAGGDMKYLGGIMRKMVNGERDPEELTKGMGMQGQSLVQSILQELGKFDLH